MKRLKHLIRTSLLGGLAVILPMAIMVYAFKWLFNVTTDIIQPLTDLLMAQSQIQELLADGAVLAILLSGCFVVGLIVRTKVGHFLHENLVNRILKLAPGYTFVRETVEQFTDDAKSPFTAVALVQVFENSTLMTGFITDVHKSGGYTVFVPTGPNPTSGNIYHVQEKFLHHVDVSVEDAMRSIVSCGAGSTKLVESYGSLGNPANTQGSLGYEPA